MRQTTIYPLRRFILAIGLSLLIEPSLFGQSAGTQPLDGLVTPGPAELAQRRSWSAEDKLIGTTYFYWYRWPDLHFFDDAEHTDDAITDHFVSPQSVSMTNVSWHKKEVSDMIDAGIDMAWCVYWACPANLNMPIWRLFVSGLTPLQEALDELEAEGKSPPKVGMFYDTSSLTFARFSEPPGSTDLTAPWGKDFFYRTIRSFFCAVHPKHWACIDGRPIVVLYTSSFAEKHDQSSIDYVYNRFAEEFGGIRPYIIRDVSWNVRVDSNYCWGAALHGPYIDGIAAVGPGYDDSAVIGRRTPIRKRENGNFYRWSWLQVLKSPVKIVHIETWNEMHEGTDICESAEYGRQYIELTAHYAAHFKAGTVPDERVELLYPVPILPPPNMDDGREYAEAKKVEIQAEKGKMIEDGISYVANIDGTLDIVDHAGDTFLRTETGYICHYAYFAVKDPFYYDQRRRVLLTIEYLDKGRGSILLQYDSYDRSGVFEGSYTDAHAFILTDTGSMMTRNMILEDARFASRQNNGADFRYYVHNGPFFIKRISIQLLNLPEPVLRVTGLEPAPGSQLDRVPEKIIATFSEDVLASSVKASTFRLVRSGGDGIFGNKNDVEITAASITTNGNQAVFDLTEVKLPEDVYQVTLVGRGMYPILDTKTMPNCYPLDGKFDGSFPSGDGRGATDFHSIFTVKKQ